MSPIRDEPRRAAFYLPESLIRQLDEASDVFDMSKSEIVRDALWRWIRDHVGEPAIAEKEWDNWMKEYDTRLYSLLREFEMQARLRAERLARPPRKRNASATKRPSTKK